MKKLFEGLKKDITFKSAGPGKKLTDDSSSSRGPVVQQSGQAKPQPTLTEGVQRAGMAALARIEQKRQPCPGSSHSVIRNQVKKELEDEAAAEAGQMAAERLENDPVEASIMMIHTFNKDREKVKEKLSSLEGSTEFLQALGFHSTILPVEGQELSEEFLWLEDQDPGSLEVLKEARDRLQVGEPVRARLDRRPQAYCPSPHASNSHSTSTTSLLRSSRGSSSSGTFLAREYVGALFQFVWESLVDGWQPFELLAPGGHRLKEEEEVVLNECGLVPSALLSLSWDTEVQADVATAGGQCVPLLRPELLENIQTIS